MSDTENTQKPLPEASGVTTISVESELKNAYLDYAMSVIIGRALPDVRDGLKPVHRRSLYAMHELGNNSDKPYKKSARIVGDVIGKYHPHGDTAVYDTIVRMAQPFSLRYMLVDGQGNFGSVDGDSPAAMRYTEIRMSKMAHALMADLEKETVDFGPNYDGSESMPLVFPTRVPNLLVNGSSGIAVGMATNIPPHNINEVIDACLALMTDPTLDIEGLMAHIPGPDFPTAALINGRSGIIQAYRTGRGRIHLRARTHIETDPSNKKQTIVVTELPYQVNKARLLEKMAELVKLKRIEGITALRDESDKSGMRMVIEVRRGENAEVLLNNLYTQTQLQVVFGINMVALDQNRPKLLNLKQILECFIQHRREIVTRRTIYLLRKARDRGHILEGLGIALSNIDEMIALIKASKTPALAKEKLLDKTWAPGLVKALLTQVDADARPDDLPEGVGMINDGYRLSPLQAQAILELRLHKLTGLEQDKIIKEYTDLLEVIKYYLDILSNPDLMMQVIRDDLLEVKEQFGDERRTEILDSHLDLTNEDLIPQEDVVVTLSAQGYVKSQQLGLYQSQHRGGRGKSATAIKEEDHVTELLIANSHDTILCFSSRGRLYWLKTYLIPQSGRAARGRPIINLLPLTSDETITAILPVSEFTADHYVFMATRSGVVKKVSLDHFSRPRTSGIIALDLSDDDELIGAQLTHGENDIMLFSNAGKAIRFHEDDVRPMGRTARGVRGVKLKADQHVISLIVAGKEGAILTATENGYGKRTALDEFRKTGRGGQGVIAIQVSDRNGAVIAAEEVHDNDEVLLMTNGGTMVRTPISEISLQGRNTQGVRLINLSNAEQLIGMERVQEVADEDMVLTEDDVND